MDDDDSYLESTVFEVPLAFGTHHAPQTCT